MQHFTRVVLRLRNCNHHFGCCAVVAAQPPMAARKRAKRRKKSKRTSETKKVIVDAMKEKDAAEALGDAIRDRADDLRKEQAAESDPLLQSIDGSVASVGRAMGASDYDAEDDAGGVRASPTSVIANYFLKSHGGAHMLQSASSLLATACGLGCLMMTSRYSAPTDAASVEAAMGNAKWTLVLLRRTLIFAMVKHVSGLLASASVAAKAIPKIGIAQSRKWMEDISREPVAQYVFYTALMLLWLPRNSLLLLSPAQEGGASSTIGTTWWWPKQRWVVTFFLLGPILLREIVSNILIISDVLVLWNVGSNSDNGVLERVLEVSQSVVNAVMSLLVSPNKWRSADPAQRQEILAGLVSKASLFLEAGVGGILVVDLAIGILRVLFGTAVMGGGRPSLYETLSKLFVIRLYVHYLVWIRRKNLSKLGTELRGGAVQLPFWVLDTLEDPAKALGISSRSKTMKKETDDFSLRELFSIGFGLESTSSSSSQAS
mmetsp:Transcript_27536/g.75152  ORF Transcript_27536/g.75152 Transcript_27536/m.75152 type:complete len:488 (+) Transcript_27536:910-2373(+)